MRSKVYVPTEQGNEMIDSLLAEFISSIEYMLMNLKEDINYRKDRSSNIL